jgi:hypothetical protein
MATTITIPLDLKNPQVASNPGNSFFNVLGLTNWDAGVWDFVKSVQGNIFGTVKIPHIIAGTPNAKIVLSLMWNATTGVAVMQIGSKNLANGATYNVSFTNETAQNVSVPGTAYFRTDVTFTLTNPPSADDELVVEILHNGTSGSDTAAVDTLLVDAWLQIDIA